MVSKRFRFNQEDMIKLAKSAILVGVTALVLFVADSIDLIDFSTLGQWAAPVGAIATFGVNLLRKWLKGAAS